MGFGCPPWKLSASIRPDLDGLQHVTDQVAQQCMASAFWIWVAKQAMGNACLSSGSPVYLFISHPATRNQAQSILVAANSACPPPPPRIWGLGRPEGWHYRCFVGALCVGFVFVRHCRVLVLLSHVPEPAGL